LQDANSKAIGADQNMANAWGTMMQAVGNIQNNSAFDQQTKTTLIQNTLNGFGSFATYYSKVTGIDVAPLLNFSMGGATAGAPKPGAAAPAPAPAPKPGTPGYFLPSYGDETGRGA
jgi:hypothetical protein